MFIYLSSDLLINIFCSISDEVKYEIVKEKSVNYLSELLMGCSGERREHPRVAVE
jgi:hypothetical protein